jgi:hypothetical protein
MLKADAMTPVVTNSDSGPLACRSHHTGYGFYREDQLSWVEGLDRFLGLALITKTSPVHVNKQFYAPPCHRYVHWAVSGGVAIVHCIA